MSPVKELKQVKLHIEPGEIKIDENAAHILVENPDVVVVSITMESKYVDVCGHTSGGMIGTDCVSGPGIILGANERTLYKDDAHKDKFTMIVFPDYADWECLADSTGRYDVIVVLVRKKALYGED